MCIKFVFRDSGPLWLVFPVECVDIVPLRAMKAYDRVRV